MSLKIAKYSLFLLLLINLLFFSWTQYNASQLKPASLKQVQKQVANEIKNQINPNFLQIKDQGN